MPPIVIPAIIVALCGFVFFKKDKKGMTPERQKAYDAALRNLRDPEALRALSSDFGAEGCKAESAVLGKLADYLELPHETKMKHKALFKETLTLKDPEKVDYMAEGFENMGAIGAAGDLREYAANLRKAG